jgi:hypothetical protein
MRHMTKLTALALVLAAASANADILPEPDAGPPMGSAAGLDFMIQDVTTTMPTGYTKSWPVVVLTGCTEGKPNCTLARSRNLIGAEVEDVNGANLEPDKGRVRQIMDAFAHNRSVVLTLYSRASGTTSKVTFAGH